MLKRREFLVALATIFSAPALARAANLNPAATFPNKMRLAAAWQAEHDYQVGLLSLSNAGLQIISSLRVPTRAHYLFLEPSGTLLTVARRPGDWLLRWNRAGQAIKWLWIEPRRAFAGHVVTSADGNTVYTTEIDLDSGLGLIGVRDGMSLEKRAEWPTHGMDPHQLIWDISFGNAGQLIVANGGVPTQPETGRMKLNMQRMDSSIVRIDGKNGELLGQWRLDDPRLSLRHLAWNGEQLGIALQAEHDDAETKANAPLLALFDGISLRAVAAPTPLAGYGGNIAAIGAGFAVSCPRAEGVAIYGANGRWQEMIPLQDAYQLASAGAWLWAGGHTQALGIDAADGAIDMKTPLPDIRLDNHWIAILRQRIHH